MGARIITLESSNTKPRAASFEEAFGEFSEARGRGKARRTARKEARQEKKSTRRTARKDKKLEKISNKDEVKRARRGGRISRRQERQGMRQDKRSARTEAKIDRKNARATSRADRRALRDEPEMEDNYDDNYDEAYEDEGYDDQGYDDEGYADEGYADDGYADDGYDEDYADEYEESSVGNSVEPAENYDESYDDDYADEAEYDEGYDDEEYGDEGYYDDYGDDGYEDEMMGADGGSFSKEALKPNAIHPLVLKNARRIEKAKFRSGILNARRERIIAQLSKPNNPQPHVNQLSAQLKKIDKRIEKSNSILNDAESRFSGFSGADGGKFEKKRGAMIGRARLKAKREHAKFLSSKRLGARKNKMVKNLKRKGFGGDVTPVQSDLNPNFEPQRIVVPAKSGFDGGADSGTGFIALDNRNDFDAPEMETVELMSNMSGEKKKNLVYAVVGIGLAIAAIYAYKKYSKK